MSDEFDRRLRELGGGFLPVSPVLVFLYRIVVDCDPPVELGRTATGVRRVIPIIGGRFEGPELRGSVLSIGADWNTADSDTSGKRRVDTRYLLQTDDGAVIGLSTLGFSQRTAEVMALRESGRPVDPASYYFRQHLFFETAAKKMNG
jgi:hypothetical protein